MGMLPDGLITQAITPFLSKLNAHGHASSRSDGRCRDIVLSHRSVSGGQAVFRPGGSGAAPGGQAPIAEPGRGAAGRFDLPRLQPADRHRLLALLGRLLRFHDGRRGAGVRQPGRQSAVDRGPCGHAVGAVLEPRRRGAHRGGNRPGGHSPSLAAGAGRRVRDDAARAAAVRRAVHDRAAGAGRRAGGRRDGFRGHRFGADQRRQAHAGRYLVRAWRFWLQAAAGTQSGGRDLRRLVRRRGLPRPQGGRRLVCREIQQEAQGGRFRGHDQVPLRSPLPDRRDAGRQLRDARRAADVLQLPQHLRQRRAAAAGPRPVHRQSLPEAVQRRDDPAQAAGELRRALRGGLQKAAGRVQEGLRAVPDDGAAGRESSTSGRPSG